MAVAIAVMAAGCGASAAGTEETFIEDPTADTARFELTSEGDLMRVSGAFDYGDERGLAHVSEGDENGRWDREVRFVGDMTYTAWEGRYARWGFNEDVYWARMPVDARYAYFGDATYPLLDVPGRRDPDEIWREVTQAAKEIVEVGPEIIRSVSTMHSSVEVSRADAGMTRSSHLDQEPKKVVRIHAWIDRNGRVRRMRFDHHWLQSSRWVSVDFFDFGVPVEVARPDRSLNEEEFDDAFSSRVGDFDVPEGLSEQEEDCYLAKLSPPRALAELVCSGKVSFGQDPETSCALARLDFGEREADEVCKLYGEDS